MMILMHARVLNEEALVLRGAEIAATGKLADPQSLLCYHGNNSPGALVYFVFHELMKVMSPVTFIRTVKKHISYHNTVVYISV